MRDFRTAAASAALLFGLGGALSVAPVAAQAQIGISINVGFPPPPLPIYEQPPIPDYGYIWAPGYWAFDEGIGDYYWVPGTWVLPPRIGLLWTPGYWGWNGGRYLFNQGYWGRDVGYYGGIDYGYGYGGEGFEGGRWQGNRFYYNSAVNNIGNRRITTVYRKIVVTRTVSKFSFNGPGGVIVRPTPRQLAVAREARVSPTPVQLRHRQIARGDPGLRASVNHGKPAVAATERPTVFKGPGVVTAAKVVKPYERPANAPPVKAPAGARPAETPRPGTGGAATAQSPKRVRPSPDQRPPMVRPQPDQRPARPDRPPRPDRPVNPDRPPRPDRPVNSDRPPRPERPVNPDRPSRPPPDQRPAMPRPAPDQRPARVRPAPPPQAKPAAQPRDNRKDENPPPN